MIREKRHSIEDVKEMLAILPVDFIEKAILDEVNKTLSGKPNNWRVENERLYKISKTFNDDFVKEMLSFNEIERRWYDKNSGEFPNNSGKKIIESYKRLIDENVTGEDQSLICNIGERVYTWRYAHNEKSINGIFIQRIYLCGILEEIFDSAREVADSYLSDG